MLLSAKGCHLIECFTNMSDFNGRVYPILNPRPRSLLEEEYVFSMNKDSFGTIHEGEVGSFGFLKDFNVNQTTPESLRVGREQSIRHCTKLCDRAYLTVFSFFHYDRIRWYRSLIIRGSNYL